MPQAGLPRSHFSWLVANMVSKTNGVKFPDVKSDAANEEDGKGVDDETADNEALLREVSLLIFIFSPLSVSPSSSTPAS